MEIAAFPRKGTKKSFPFFRKCDPSNIDFPEGIFRKSAKIFYRDWKEGFFLTSAFAILTVSAS